MRVALQIVLFPDLVQMETVLQILLFRAWLNLKFPAVAQPLYVEGLRNCPSLFLSERDYARHCAARWSLGLEPISRKAAAQPRLNNKADAAGFLG